MTERGRTLKIKNKEEVHRMLNRNQTVRRGVSPNIVDRIKMFENVEKKRVQRQQSLERGPADRVRQKESPEPENSPVSPPPSSPESPALPPQKKSNTLKVCLQIYFFDFFSICHKRSLSSSFISVQRLILRSSRTS